MSLEFFDQGKKYVGGADDNICPICHEDLNETEVTIMCHECGQKFHHECIKEWCTTSSGYTNQKGCPSCRDPNICTNNFEPEFNMTHSLEILRRSHREYSMDDGTEIGRARLTEANREFTQMENQFQEVWHWMLNHLIEFIEDFNVPFPNQNNYEEPNEQSNRTDNARSLLQEIEDNPNWFRTPRLNNSKDVAHLCDLYDLMILNWDEYKRLEGGYLTELFGRPLRFLFTEEQNIYAQRIRAQRKYKSLQVKIFIFTMILQNRDTHTREQVNNADRGAQTDDDLGPVMPATLERERTQMEAPREQTLTAAEANAIAAQVVAERRERDRRRGIATQLEISPREAEAIAAQIVAERRERDRRRGAQTDPEAGIDVQIAEINAQIDAERNRRDAAEMRIAEANMRTAEAERRIADAQRRTEEVERRIADMGISGGKPKKRTYKKRTYKKRTYKKKTKQLFGWGKNPKLEKFWRELASGKKVIIVYNNDKIENYNMPKTKNAAHKKYIELLNNNEIKAIITSGQSSDIYEALYKRVKNKSPQEIIKNYKKYLWQYESGEKEYYL